MADLGLPPYLEGMTGDKQLSKAVNRGILLELVRRRGSVSRAALAKESGLTKATVSSQIAELIAMGVLRETGAADSGLLGRKPVMLEIDAEAGFCLGISVGTECLHALVMDLSGRVVRDELVSLEGTEPAGVADSVRKLIKAYKRSCRASRFGIIGLGIAAPGAVDRGTGTIIRSAKLDWSEVSILPLLAKSFDGILHIGNDATLATIAERELNAPDADDFVCLLIDEGIGSGAYIHGAIHYGHNGQFGEVGHMTVVHGGPRCPCGNYGCWDLYGSELALRQALAELDEGPLPSMEDTLRLARELPERYRATFFEFVDYLVSGLVGIVNALAPATLTVNCGVLSASPELFELLKSKVAERSMAHIPACDLRLSSLGKAAPALGACMAVRDMFFQGLVLADTERAR